MVKFTAEEIAGGIVHLFPNLIHADEDEVDTVIQYMLKQSYHGKGCQFEQLCRVILKDYSEKTVLQNVRKCYHAFGRYVLEITDLIKFEQSKSAVSPENISLNQVENENDETSVSIRDEPDITHTLQINSTSTCVDIPLIDDVIVSHLMEIRDSYHLSDNINAVSDSMNDSRLKKREVEDRIINKEAMFCTLDEDSSCITIIASDGDAVDAHSMDIEVNRNYTILSNYKSCTETPIQSPLSEEDSDLSSVNVCEEETKEIPNSNDSIIVPSTFWEKYWTGRRNLRRGWTDAFVQYFKSKYPCVLSFESSKCNQPRDRVSTYFYARAHCMHPSCTHYKFTVLEVISPPFKDMCVFVNQEKKVNHVRGEIYRRLIKGEKRAAIAQNLKSSTASRTRLEMIAPKNEMDYNRGDATESPTLITLQNIVKETRRQADLDPDDYEFMKKLTKQLREMFPGKIVEGYIQHCAIEPVVFVILFTELQLRYLLTLPKNKVFCHLDATGSIVSSKGMRKTVFYYALVVADIQGKQPLPIGELITTEHHVESVRSFLSLIHLKMRKISPSKALLIEKVETDFSLALIQAVTLSFNKVDAWDYLSEAYNYLNGNEYRFSDMTVIHICSSHFIKTVIRYGKQIFSRKEQRLAIAASFTKLIHCENIENALKIFESFIEVFGLKRKSKDFSKHLEILTMDDNVKEKYPNFENLSAINDVDVSVSDEISSGEDYSDPEEKNEEGGESTEVNQGNKTCSKREMSPFYKLFSKVHDDKVNAHSNEVDDLNEYYNSKFMTYTLKFLVPYFPLWSAVIIMKRFGILRDSNAPIENWFKIVKHDIFGNKLNMSIPRFVNTMAPLLKSRLLDREYKLERGRNNRNRNNENASLELATEKWKRKKSENNKYFKKNKISKIEGELPGTKIKDSQDQSQVVTKMLPDSPDGFGPNVQVTAFEFPAGIEDTENNARQRQIFSSVWPEGFPDVRKNIAGICVDNASFSTLIPNQGVDSFVDDNIINSFFVLLQNVWDQQQKIMICSDTFFGACLMQGTISSGFKKWARIKELHKYDAWMIPVHHERSSHWTLLVVNFVDKLFIHFDSMHKKPPRQLIENLCGFLKNQFEEENMNVKWKDWKCYAPNDIPSQITDQGVGENCGIHSCIWGYIISMGTRIVFKETDMGDLRKGIANFIINGYVRETVEDEKVQMRCTIYDGDLGKITKNYCESMTPVQIPPIGFEDTLTYCASMLNQKKEFRRGG